MKERVCLHCGATIEEAGEFGMIEVWEHDPEIHDDGQSHLMGHICAERVPCIERNIATGHNPEALRTVIRDSEHYTQDLRDRAREALRMLAEAARIEAESADAAAREMGYGAIGSVR